LIQLVSEIPIDSLIQKVKSRKFQGKFNPDSNSELVLSSEMSVVCPLTLARIQLPARGMNCTHLSCFDLENFLIFVKDTNRWVCPICLIDLSFATLYIDHHVKKLFLNLDDDDEKIFLEYVDGELRKVKGKKGAEETKKKPKREVRGDQSIARESVEILDNDDDDDDDPFSNINEEDFWGGYEGENETQEFSPNCTSRKRQRHPEEEEEGSGPANKRMKGSVEDPIVL